jgi:hypothetical protein
MKVHSLIDGGLVRRLFVVVAVVEACYALLGVFVPPSMVATILGWNLSPDGQWVAKLLGLALGAQALTAWVLRERPPVAVARILAGYQLAAAAMDAVMWLLLADEGIFASPLTRASVIVSIPLHATIGVLLFAAAARTRALTA